MSATGATISLSIDARCRLGAALFAAGHSKKPLEVGFYPRTDEQLSEFLELLAAGFVARSIGDAPHCYWLTEAAYACESTLPLYCF